MARSTCCSTTLAESSAAALDPSYLAVRDAATAQIAAAVVVTAFVLPFMVARFANWQKRRGVSPQNEEAFYESGATEVERDKVAVPL